MVQPVNYAVPGIGSGKGIMSGMQSGLNLGNVLMQMKDAQGKRERDKQKRLEMAELSKNPTGKELSVLKRRILQRK